MLSTFIPAFDLRSKFEVFFIVHFVESEGQGFSKMGTNNGSKIQKLRVLSKISMIVVKSRII